MGLRTHAAAAVSKPNLERRSPVLSDIQPVEISDRADVGDITEREQVDERVRRQDRNHLVVLETRSVRHSEDSVSCGRSERESRAHVSASWGILRALGICHTGACFAPVCVRVCACVRLCARIYLGQAQPARRADKVIERCTKDKYSLFGE